MSASSRPPSQPVVARRVTGLWSYPPPTELWIKEEKKKKKVKILNELWYLRRSSMELFAFPGDYQDWVLA